MTFKYLVGLVAMSVTPFVAGQDSLEATLSPVLSPSVDTSDNVNIVPSADVSLHYGVGQASLVNISLSMNYPSVLLEEIDTVTDVTCTASSVVVTFNSSEAFAVAVSEWVTGNPMVLITNHLGACDAEVERGIFVAETFVSDETHLTISAAAQKKDIASTAGMLHREMIE
jgi:hypothetical protein